MKPIDIKGQNNIQKTLPCGAEVPKLVFETLKPLRAACVENDYMFMAYLIEMIEVEAYTHIRAKQNTTFLPVGDERTSFQRRELADSL